jgi:hypothetical protein
MNAVLVRPLPYKEAEQLVILWQLNRLSGDHEVKITAPDYIDLKEQNNVFQDIAAFGDMTPTTVRGANNQTHRCAADLRMWYGSCLHSQSWTLEAAIWLRS